MSPRRRLLPLGLLAAAAAISVGACHKKEAPAPVKPVEQKPYTPVPPPPTRTLRPGEPTPLPRLPE